MRRFKIETPIPLSKKTVVAGFNRELFEALTPPFTTIEIDRYDGHFVGARIELQISLFGLMQTWVSEITDTNESELEFYFVDTGVELPAPLKSWKHIHRVVKTSETTSKIVDDITFSTGNKISDLALLPFLKSLFALRKTEYQSYYLRRQ